MMVPVLGRLSPSGGAFGSREERNVRRRGLGVTVEALDRIASGRFEVLPRRWVVKRTWSWLMNNHRLQVDYERDPKVPQGFVWAAHSRQLMRRLTT